MGFVVAMPRPSQSIGGVRFVALRDGDLVGVACLVPVPGRGGWFIEHLLRDPKAPNGTVELLVDAVMRWAAEAGSSWLTLGLAPLAGDVAGPLGFARRHLRPLYDFEGLRRFKAKLRPSDWMPIYLAFPRSQGPVASTFDALTAFATGGMLRFGLRFVTRGHPAVLAAAAVLLIPWMVVLAVLPASRWFAGHVAVKWAWVAFDVAVCLGLLQMLRRPSWRLSALLAMIVSCDAILSLLEIACWNVPRADGWMDELALGAAALAPVLAARALWGATVRLRQAG
ncbi:MAG: phosphatidylglycerol lysyltransferase domain-containing protein [Polyangiaceae bacterium]